MTVGAELGEAVEVRVGRELLETRAIRVDEVEVEISAARVLVVGRKNDSTAVRSEERREVRPTEVRHLALVGSIGVHHPDLHLVRTYHLLPQEIAIGPELY